jgi:osmotically-inducible protein OsmY
VSANRANRANRSMRATGGVALWSMLFTLLALPAAAAPAPAFRAGQTADTAVVAAVKRALAGDDNLRRLTVSVSGTEVTLAGKLPTLRAKLDAVKRVLKVEGVKTVRTTEIELPKQESDGELAVFLGPAIDRYPYYTMFDYIDATIRNGIVTLLGSVTGERNKAQEIEDEVAKVRGVQEVRNQIETLPPSLGDDNLRAAIAERIASSNDFDQYANMRNPPFHIVVRNGNVTLFGRVQSEVDYRQLESLIRFTGGVQRVENKLQPIAKPKR